LQPIIVTALDHIDKAETRALRLANLEVLVNAVLYNPSAALHLMETARPGMGRVFIVALCALMEMHPNAIPETPRPSRVADLLFQALLLLIWSPLLQLVKILKMD